MNPMFDLDLLSFALSSMPFSLSIWNPRLRSFIWTEAQATIHGLNLSQFDGRLESFLQAIHSHDIEFVRNFFTDIEYPEPDIGLRLYRILDVDDHVRWIQGLILLGQDTGTVVGRSLLEFVIPDDRAIVSQLLQDCDNQPKSLMGVRIHILDLAVGWFNLWWQGDRERRQGTLFIKPQQEVIQRSRSRRSRRTPSDRT